MDAHTLNAWTRFALQKGGIGTCTALVDNPATEAEDLMFMTGEKIIVLRRLDNEATQDAAVGSSKRKSNTHEDTWFLGYCEGVVGKFKGAHVQIHGKLKKPVLMRRSGQGQIRESSTQIMSQAAAASLPASQVPVGLPIGTVESENDELAQQAQSPNGLTDAASDRASVGRSLVAEPSSSVGHMSNGHNSPSIPSVASHSRNNGVQAATTPTLPDRTSYRSRSSSHDSDDSSTMLPWARTSAIESNKKGPPTQWPSHAASSTRGIPSRLDDVQSGARHSDVSPVDSRGACSTETSGSKSTNSSRVPYSPSQDSNATATTDDDSDDEFSGGSRRDHTLSIYDVYGRDSVAFPNFNLNGVMSASDTAQSIKIESDKHPTPPLAPEHVRANMRNSPVLPAHDVAARLRASPSGRRPNAAPDPRVPSHQGRALASSLRHQVEAVSPVSETGSDPAMPVPVPMQATASAPGSPAILQNEDRFSGPPNGSISYDPHRRPLPQPAPRAGGPPPKLAQLRIPHQAGALVSPPSADAGSPLGPPQGVPRPGQGLPAGFGPGSFMTGPNLNRPGGPRSPGPALDAAGAVSPTGNYFPPGVMNSVGPKRSSSDRTSQRERAGSEQLRKNPSNPSPASYRGGSAAGPRGSSGGGTGMDVLSPPSAPSVGGRRSPSPLGASPNGTLGTRSSPIEPSPVSRSVSPAGSAGVRPQVSAVSLNTSGARLSNGGPSRGFDAKGFRLGLGPPCRAETEDPEAVAKWRQIISENDLAAARKSRKVRKMVQSGIPNSIRGQVWLFLSNASVRRRPGLFEQLCVTSQSTKGRKGKEALYETIEKDVSRTYPDNRNFEEGSPGHANLEAILKAYVHYNPIIGYTQGMGLLVGMFLLHMAAEDAFWLLCAMLRDIHMEGYYSNEMKQMHIDGVIFGQLLQNMDEELANKLQAVGVEPINFTPNWFLPLFCRILPWPASIRVFDIFFYEGPNWILQTALSVIRIIREPLMAASGPSASEDVLRLLLHPPPHELTSENVLSCALTVKLKDGEMRKLSRNASKLVRESQMTRGRRGSAAPLSAGPGGSSAGAGGANGNAAVGVPSRR